MKSELPTFKAIFKNLDRTPENIQLGPILLTYILNDLVFEATGIEEEDYIALISPDELDKNQDLLSSFSQIEMGVVDLIRELDLIPPQLMAQAMGMGMPGMGGPGMGMPGMSGPGMGMPGLGGPGMGMPGQMLPGIAMPGMMPQGMPGMMPGMFPPDKK